MGEASVCCDWSPIIEAGFPGVGDRAVIWRIHKLHGKGGRDQQASSFHLLEQIRMPLANRKVDGIDSGGIHLPDAVGSLVNTA